VKTQASTTLTSATLSQGVPAFRLLAALLLVMLPTASAMARVRHNDAWARQQFVKAERMREALNGRPAAQRTPHEYQRVIDSYRRVYFGSPASSKADPSVVATAELMVEMGRRFDDNKILRGAIGQYRFLRKEYPGSKYRFDALFTIGEIFKDDLHDPAEARATFEDFLRRYPRNRLTDDAEAAIKEINAEAQARERSGQRPASRKQRPPSSHGNANGAADGGNLAAADNAPQPATAPVGPRNAFPREGLPRVTGVRHWSTPDYTRVAIDVEEEVKFGSQRISNPDRIFFDLRDTRLASTLVGKTFDVDDGFLKKIRVAEFQPGKTRIVLEVDNLASYDAFLLPDPYRLIIDVHGKDAQGQRRAKAVANPAVRNEANDSPTVNIGLAADDSAANASADSPQPASERPAIAATKSGPLETDLTPADTSADSQSADTAQPVQGIGVVRTTVAVKGSNRRIPKTIVEAEDHAPSKAAAIEHGKVRFKRTPDDAIEKSDMDTSDLRHDNLTATRDTTREARPTAAGGRSLIRALGLKIGKIVIDPGHGGHDTGTIGPNGLLEKDVALDVAKRLGRLLETRLGAEVIYTRHDDTFIPLETRTAIANRERADLFISIHANSSRDADARGVETYYLNFTSSAEALEVAARENAVSEKSIHELQDLVKKIALKEKIDESREFAGDVQQSLYGGLSPNNAGIRNRGIKKAPFIVLIGANMPSILAEISFVSNPTDARKLETSEYRQRISESLYRGVSKYVSGLSGVKVASKIDRPEGQ
jgi:N-acetylmuramoyl-L-alanine amidase